MITRPALALYSDAMIYSTGRILSKLLDDVKVDLWEEPYYAVSVRMSGKHRGKTYAYSTTVDIDMLTPDMYAKYIREELPTRAAHEFVDFILRGSV